MSRPCKLTPQQQIDIFERILKGDKPADIAREVGLSKGRISQMFAARAHLIRDTAKATAEAEKMMNSMPVVDQILARTLANELKEISSNLASAARYGAQIAHRLNGIAHCQVETVDDANPENSMRALQNIAVLTKIANSSAEIGLGLLKANKDSFTPEEEPLAPLGIKFVVKSARKVEA